MGRILILVFVIFLRYSFCIGPESRSEVFLVEVEQVTFEEVLEAFNYSSTYKLTRDSSCVFYDTSNQEVSLLGNLIVSCQKSDIEKSLRGRKEESNALQCNAKINPDILPTDTIFSSWESIHETQFNTSDIEAFAPCEVEKLVIFQTKNNQTSFHEDRPEISFISTIPIDHKITELKLELNRSKSTNSILSSSRLSLILNKVFSLEEAKIKSENIHSYLLTIVERDPLIDSSSEISQLIENNETSTEAPTEASSSSGGNFLESFIENSTVLTVFILLGVATVSKILRFTIGDNKFSDVLDYISTQLLVGVIMSQAKGLIGSDPSSILKKSDEESDSNEKSRSLSSKSENNNLDEEVVKFMQQMQGMMEKMSDSNKSKDVDFEEMEERIIKQMRKELKKGGNSIRTAQKDDEQIGTSVAAIEQEFMKQLPKRWKNMVKENPSRQKSLRNMGANIAKALTAQEPLPDSETSMQSLIEALETNEKTTTKLNKNRKSVRFLNVGNISKDKKSTKNASQLLNANNQRSTGIAGLVSMQSQISRQTEQNTSNVANEPVLARSQSKVIRVDELYLDLD